MRLGRVVYIENADQDIHTVVIRNVTGAAIRHPLVAMRNHNGAKVYNILVENVMDTYFADPAEYADVPRYALVRIGNNNYWASRPSRMGETYGITIRNLRASYSLRAITVAATLKDCHFSDIGCFGFCETALSFGPTWSGVCGASMENILLDNVCVSCANPDAESCVVDFSLMGQDFKIRGLQVRHAALSGAASVVRLAGNAGIRMEDVQFDALRRGPVEYMPRHPEASVSINGKTY